MDPVGVKVSVLGSYSSADATGPDSLRPPAIRTLPLGSKVAVCPDRWIDIGPVVAKPLGWFTVGAAVGVAAGAVVAALAMQAPATTAAARKITEILRLVTSDSSPFVPLPQCRIEDMRPPWLAAHFGMATSGHRGLIQVQVVLPVLLPVPGRVQRRGAQNGDFTREILAERVRFELTGLSSSGFQVWVRGSAEVR
jgi:hypothetical protein